MTTTAKKATATKVAPAKKATATKAAPKATPAPVAAKKVEAEAAPKVEAPKPAPEAEAAPKAQPAPEAEVAQDPVAAYEAKLEQMTSQFTEGYNEMMDFGKEQMEKFFKFEGADVFKSYEDAMAFSKENVDAFVKSSSIAAKGVQDVASLLAEITKSAIEGNVESSKKVFECKTPQEVAELQQSLAKEGFDKMIADANRISEASSKIVDEAVKPLKARYEASVELVNSKAA